VSATKRSVHSHNKKPQEKKTPQNQFDDNHQTKKKKGVCVQTKIKD
jgi:hypothetical protein